MCLQYHLIVTLDHLDMETCLSKLVPMAVINKRAGENGIPAIDQQTRLVVNQQRLPLIP
jgi:hypothetical protein